MLNNVKIGIAPLTWTNDDLPELGANISFERCIAEMAEAGYQGCEIGNKFPTDPNCLSVALQQYNLSVASQWFGCYFTQPECEIDIYSLFAQRLQFLNSVGAKRVNVCEQGYSIQTKSVPLFSAHRPVFCNKQWDQLVIGLNKLAQMAASRDIQICYHQHMGTGIQTDAELERLMDETKHLDIGLLLDTGHLAYAGIDPLYIIKRYGHRINHVHLKDLRLNVIKQVKNEHLSFLQGVRRGTFTVPGDGDIDFKPILEGLNWHSYVGWLLVEAEQDPAKAHPLTFAKKGRDYICKLMEH